MAKIDMPEVTNTNKVEKRYVTVPERDLFDMPFPNIQVNTQKFSPGTHYLENQLADTVEERVKAVENANKRLMMPRRDVAAEALVARGQGSATTNF